MGNFGIFCGKCGIILGFFNLVPFMNSVYNYKSEFKVNWPALRSLFGPNSVALRRAPKVSFMNSIIHCSKFGQPNWVVNKGLT